MALFFIFSRRFHRTTQHLLPLPLINTPLHHSSSSNLSQTFQQTYNTHHHHVSNLPNFSTLHTISAQNHYDPIDFNDPSNQPNKKLDLGHLELLKRVKDYPSECEAMAFLQESGLSLDSEFVFSAIWALRDEWRLAFLVFKSGDKVGCCDEKARSLIVWVLGSCKRFNIGWCLIHDFYRSSVDIREAMFIMIDRYAAANEPSKAIRAFNIMENFRMSSDIKTLYTLLATLCKHGNVEEAEEYMLQNNKLFPLETDGFNVILSGWCNISFDVFEAKRVWREMSKRCVLPDATSYTHMISCFSKVGNLFDSLRLYDEMSKKGFVPGREVYNSLIYILTRENCFKEAQKFLEKMKEMGFQPDFDSYNSMIHPLCEAKKLDEAKIILETMIKENLNPTIETYHAFIKEVDLEGTLEVLKSMKNAGISTNKVTFRLLLNKLMKLEQPENALKIWFEMKQHVVPDASIYTLLIQGLAKCGWLFKARAFYAEMISNGFDDPKLKKLLIVQKHNKRGLQVTRRKINITRGKKGGFHSRKKKSPNVTNFTSD